MQQETIILLGSDFAWLLSFGGEGSVSPNDSTLVHNQMTFLLNNISRHVIANKECAQCN